MRKTTFRIAFALTLGLGVAAPLALAAPAGAATISPPASYGGMPIAHQATCTTGSADDSTPFSAWLADKTAVPNGTTVLLAQDQCYRMDETVVLGARTGITLNGNNAVFESFSDTATRFNGIHNDHVLLQGNSNVTVENLRIVGQERGAGYVANDAFQAGFYIVANNGVTLNNVTVNHVYGDYVGLQANSTGVVPQNVTIENSNFGNNSTMGSGAGRQGLSIDDGSNINVEFNYFGQESHSEVDIEPPGNSHSVNGVMIQQNTFGPAANFWFANIGAHAQIDNVTFFANTLTGQAMTVDSRDTTISNPSQINRTEYNIWDNTSDTAPVSCGGPVMTFVYVAGVSITGNKQPSNQCPEFVKATNVLNYGSDTTNVTANWLPNGTRAGLFDATDTVCEGGNSTVASPPPYLPIDAFATLCPGYTH